MFNNRLKISALVGLGALALAMTGCGPEMTKFKLGTVSNIKDSTMQAGGLKKVLLSQDGKLAYVLNSEGELFNVDVSDSVLSLHDASKYKPMSLTNMDQDGTASKAKLDEVEANPAANRDIVLTSKGVLVKAQLLGANNGALAYFEGNSQVPKYAWTSAAVHMAAPAPLAANSAFSQVVVAMHDGKEYAIVQNQAPAISSVELAEGKTFAGTHLYGPAPGVAFVVGVNMVASKNSTAAEPGKLFFVDASGVSFISLDKLGTNQNTAVIDAKAEAKNWSRDTTFTVAGGGGALSIAGVAVPGQTGVQNNNVRSVVLFNNKIYISLAAARHYMKKFTGGIAIYGIASGESKATTDAWSGISGPMLREHNGKLVGMHKGEVVEIDADTTALGQVVFSPYAMQSNQFSAAKTAFGGNINDVMYDGMTATPMADFALIGEPGDILGYSANGAYTVHYEEKEMEQKASQE